MNNRLSNNDFQFNNSNTSVFKKAYKFNEQE